MNTHRTPLLIDERAGRLWLYERTSVRKHATREMPADMVWMRMLGECDGEGRIISTEFAATRSSDLSPFTPLQVDKMRRTTASRQPAFVGFADRASFAVSPLRASIGRRGGVQ